MTNQPAPDGNAVAVFDRAPDGVLTPAGTFPTGGLGSGPDSPNPGGADPLGSQGSLTLSRDSRWLFAVNAGSNEISVLAVTRNGLRLVEKVASKGNRPVSVAIHRNLLYVLNAEGTISGFNLSRAGGLSALGASTRSLIGGPASAPAQVAFDPSGDLLVVTEKGTNVIDVFPVGDDGRPGDPVRNESSGEVPFGFTFGGPDVLIVSEAANSAASSYRVFPDATLQVISGSVLNGQIASCWAVVSGSYAYVSNTGSGTITGYRIGADGSLSLLDPDGVTGVTGDNSVPID
ncbi:MAG: lactonase family protein, partial [Actinomycetota bacterium]